ncbi:unnamed protein product [Diamesa serratosioi]
MLFSENSSIYFPNATKIAQQDIQSQQVFNIPSFDVTKSEVILILLTVIYIIIFITGILGNVVTCIVIAKNKSMHTAVNYYLFSLAVSDLLLLISALPDEVYTLWFQFYPFGETFCKFHRFAAETFTNATVLTITAFTVERYFAVCKPFLSHTMSKLSRAYKFILVIWIVSMGLAVPQVNVHSDYAVCVPKNDYKHLFVVSTLLIFVIPMLIITILYILIGLQLRRSKVVQRGAVNGSSVRLKRKIFKKAANQTLVTVNLQSGESPHHYSDILIQHNDNHKNHKNYIMDSESVTADDGRINYSSRGHTHGTRHIVNMLVVVVIAFFLCWCPFHIQRLLSTYIEQNAINQNIFFSVTYISGVLFFISTCINPFLYNIMSNKFREAFKVTIASYLYPNNAEKECRNTLFRTVSQRSTSNNSQSVNTCSSICSVQPFNQNQHSFRYLDSDLARRRPLVVSFRRIHKIQKQQIDRCSSNCDVHHMDMKVKRTCSNDNIGCITTKSFPKYNNNNNNININNTTTASTIIQLKTGFCGEINSNYSCRNVDLDRKSIAHGKHSTHFRTYLDNKQSDLSEGITMLEEKYVFPKEKYYGNAKLQAMDDDHLRKSVIDCDEEELDYERSLCKQYQLTKQFQTRKMLKRNIHENESCSITRKLDHRVEKKEANKIKLSTNVMIDETNTTHIEKIYPHQYSTGNDLILQKPCFNNSDIELESKIKELIKNLSLQKPTRPLSDGATSVNKLNNIKENIQMRSLSLPSLSERQPPKTQNIRTMENCKSQRENSKFASLLQIC